MTDWFAVLSDIHGNIWALDAVLADARRRGISRFLNLGDSLYGPLAPAETADRLMSIDIAGIQGNQDRELFASPPNPPPTLRFTRDALTPLQKGWLQNQPATALLPQGVFLCHGSPHSDEEYLLENASESGGLLRGEDEIAASILGVSAKVILCGHSHLPRIVRLMDGRLILNPGSVGLPAYRDENPPHKMETGTPHARYAILGDSTGDWQADLVSVVYDWEQAARCAESHSRPDWAFSLRTGRAA